MRDNDEEEEGLLCLVALQWGRVFGAGCEREDMLWGFSGASERFVGGERQEGAEKFLGTKGGEDEEEEEEEKWCIGSDDDDEKEEEDAGKEKGRAGGGDDGVLVVAAWFVRLWKKSLILCCLFVIRGRPLRVWCGEGENGRQGKKTL